MPKYIIEWRSVYNDDEEYMPLTSSPVEARNHRQALQANDTSLCGGEEYRVREIVDDKTEPILRDGEITFEKVVILGPPKVFRISARISEVETNGEVTADA